MLVLSLLLSATPCPSSDEVARVLKRAVSQSILEQHSWSVTSTRTQLQVRLETRAGVLVRERVLEAPAGCAQRAQLGGTVLAAWMMAQPTTLAPVDALDGGITFDAGSVTSRTVLDDSGRDAGGGTSRTALDDSGRDGGIVTSRTVLDDSGRDAGVVTSRTVLVSGRDAGSVTSRTILDSGRDAGGATSRTALDDSGRDGGIITSRTVSGRDAAIVTTRTVLDDSGRDAGVATSRTVLDSGREVGSVTSRTVLDDSGRDAGVVTSRTVLVSGRDAGSVTSRTILDSGRDAGVVTTRTVLDDSGRDAGVLGPVRASTAFASPHAVESRKPEFVTTVRESTGLILSADAGAVPNVPDTRANAIGSSHDSSALEPQRPSADVPSAEPLGVDASLVTPELPWRWNAAVEVRAQSSGSLTGALGVRVGGGKTVGGFVELSGALPRTVEFAAGAITWNRFGAAVGLRYQPAWQRVLLEPAVSVEVAALWARATGYTRNETVVTPDLAGCAHLRAGLRFEVVSLFAGVKGCWWPTAPRVEVTGVAGFVALPSLEASALLGAGFDWVKGSSASGLSAR